VETLFTEFVSATGLQRAVHNFEVLCLHLTKTLSLLATITLEIVSVSAYAALPALRPFFEMHPASHSEGIQHRLGF
jgi:hypothetical protein